jgi:glyoxylase-like metal-dependent hydrolase (beta-lactamase superfamily II)
MKKLWLGDKLNGGEIVLITHTHYDKVIATVEIPDGSLVKYLIKEKDECKNEISS